MKAPASQRLDEIAKIAALLRSAVFLDAPLRCQLSRTRELITCKITKINEEGIAKQLRISSLELVPTEAAKAQRFLAKLMESEAVEASMFVGDFRVRFSAVPLASGQASFTLNAPAAVELDVPRDLPRRPLETPSHGWGCVESGASMLPVRLKLRDYSLNGLGFEVSSQAPLELREDAFLTGVLASRQFTLRIERTRILYAEALGEPSGDGWFTYRLGCQLQGSEAAEDPARENRTSPRLSQAGPLSLESGLNPGRQCRVELRDVSVGGFSCRFPFVAEMSAFPVGTTVRLSELDIEGRVVFAQGDLIRVKLDLKFDKRFRSWFLRFTQLLHPTMDTWIDFFSSAAVSFAASGGTTESFLKSSAKLNRFVGQGFTALDRNPHWIQAWVEKNTRGEVIGHISCVRYGDNLWYAGDLWGSRLSQVHKQFAKRFLDSFASYAQACVPYPKTLGIWKPDHPYWQKMSDAIAGEYAQYVHEEALCYKVALLDRAVYELPRSWQAEPVAPLEGERIRRLLRELRTASTPYLAELLGFSEDGFGSPRLQGLIHDSGYPFDRAYFELGLGRKRFLTIISRYPPGTSLQQHQESVWLLPLTGGALSAADFDELIPQCAALSLKMGVLPAYVKIATSLKLPFLPKPMRLVVSDPRMWSLA